MKGCGGFGGFTTYLKGLKASASSMEKLVASALMVFFIFRRLQAVQATKFGPTILVVALLELIIESSSAGAYVGGYLGTRASLR